MDAFPSSYLKAADLGHSRVLVTIQKVVIEAIGDDHKPVVYFVGKEKGLVLNKTNAQSIAEIAGTYDSDEWGGVQIRLFATKTDYAGKRVDCIRVDAVPQDVQAEVRPPKPPKQGPVAEDDIPF